MNNLFLASFLFILGLFFWSFASVIIYRLHSWESWIFFWRSHCPKCNHILGALELIPVFSYLKNLWKCKYCKQKISITYPILEFSFWLIFALVWYFLINFNLILAWNFLEIFKLFFFLYISFFSMILVFYDIFYLEISEKVLLLLIIPTFLVLLVQTFFPEIKILATLASSIYNWEILFLASFISILGIIWLYIIMLKELELIWDFFILWLIILSIFLLKNFFDIDLSLIPVLSWFIWALWIFIFFFLQIAISKWRWMWGWDLRIAIFMGLILWVSYSFIWTMISYVIWSIIWIFIIIYKKFEKKKLIEKILNKEEKNIGNTEVPFWPFLIFWLFSVLFFSEKINEFINKFFYL